MKKIILSLTTVLVLTGCSTVGGLVEMIPSFWDDNQSARIVNVRQTVANISCEPGTQAQDAEDILWDIQWFKLYSESKGARQKDVIRIVAPMEETAQDWLKRSQTKEGSKAYCMSKKRILEKQSARAAEAILGRF